MKTKVCGFISVVFFILTAFFVSCEVGLGAAVDTQSPELEIQYPKRTETIRGIFSLQGTYDDDGAITSVIVTMSQTGASSDKNKSFSAKIDKKNKTWSCVINPLDETNPIDDGTYNFEVAITDGGEHKTTQSTVLTIDNTAPVIALTRPGSIYPNSNGIWESYGQDFILTGNAADTCETKEIIVKVYDINDLETPLYTSKRTKVDSEFKITVASYDEESNDELNAYKKIYYRNGNDDLSVINEEKKFICSITAFDNAIEYIDDKGSTDATGNSREYFYLYNGEPLYSKVFGKYGMFSTYKILNNTFESPSADKSAQDAYAEIKELREAILSVENRAEYGYFSLNPANNPSFMISGQDPLTKDENDEGGHIFKTSSGDRREEVSITKNSTIVVEVAPGLDLTALSGDSLGIYVQECDEDANVTGDKVYLIKPLIADSEGTAFDGVTAEDKAKRDAAIKFGDSKYKFTFKLTTDIEGFATGKSYILGVDGFDNKGVKVRNAVDKYGFFFSSGATAPIVTADSDVVWISVGNNKTDSAHSEVKTDITIKNGDEPFTVLRSLYTKSKVLVEEKTIFDRLAKENPDDTYIAFVDAYEIPSSVADDEYEIRYTVTDSNKTIGLASSIVKVDSTIPTVKKINIPTTTQTENASYRFTGEVSDEGEIASGIDTVEFMLSDESDSNNVKKTGWIKASGTTEWEYTTVFNDNETVTGGAKFSEIFAKEGWKKIEVRTYDKAGNYSSKGSSEFRYDKSFPEISVSGYTIKQNNRDKTYDLNGKLSFETMDNFTLSGTASDGFGVDTITMVQIIKNGDEEIKTAIDVEYDGFVWTVKNLPRNPENKEEAVEKDVLSGTYSYEIAVTDKADKRTPVSVRAVIDIEPPVIDITSPGASTSLSGTNSISDTYLFRGNVRDGNGGVGTKKYSYLFTQSSEPAADAVWTTVDNSGDGSWTIAKDVIAGTESDGNGTLYEGHWYLFMNAEDMAGNKSGNISREFWVDKTNPTININVDTGDNCKIISGTYYFDSDLTGKIIDAYDTHGGAEGIKIFYQIDNGEEIELVGDAWKEGNFGNGSQKAYGIKGKDWKIPFAELDKIDWSEKHELKIGAIDRVGKKTLNRQTILLDKASPEVTVAAPAENQMYEGRTITISGNIRESGIGVDGGVDYVITREGEKVASGTAVVTNDTWRAANVNLGEKEGNFVISLKAKDKMGHESVETKVPFIYDAANPLLSETAVGTRTKITNGAVTFSGTAKDTNKLVSVIIKDSLNANAEWKVKVAEDGSWSQTIEAGEGKTKLTDGAHVLTITATDAVGKTKSETRNVTVDTKAPEVTGAKFVTEVLNLDEGKSLMLEAEAADVGEGSGIKSVKYYFTDSNKLEKPETKVWENLLSSNNVWVKTVDFTGKTDGNYYAYIRVEDNAGNVTYGNISAGVYVDTAKPVISVSGAPTAENNTVTLNVTVTDFNPTAPVVSVADAEGNAVTASIKNETSVEGGKKWDVEIPFTEANADGTYTVTVNAKDTVARAAAQKVHTILKDSKKPRVSIESPAEYLKFANYEFQGTAVDLNLETVKIELIKDGEPTGRSENLSTNHDNVWTWKVYELEDGAYSVKVTAKDRAGHTTVQESSVMIVDTNAPSSTIKLESGSKFFTANGNAIVAGTELTSGSTYIAGGAYRLSGIVTETNLESVKINDEEAGLRAGKWEYTGTLNEGDSDFNIAVTDLAGNRSEYRLTVKYDVSGPVVSVAVPETGALIESQKINISGTVTDQVAGVSSVAYKITKGSVTVAEGNADVSNGNWSKRNVDLGTAEGDFVFTVVAADKIGNETESGNISFTFDKAAPVLTETGIPDAGKTTNGGDDNKLTLRGTAGDTNGLASVVITDNMNPASSWTVNVEENGSWMQLIELDNEVNKLAEGVHILTITATDVAGRTSSLTRKATIDKQVPVVESAAFADSLYVNGLNNMMLTVVARDNEGGTGVKAVSYYFAPESYTLTGSERWDSLLPSGNNWIKTVDFRNTTDGTYYAHIKVEDNAGNVSVSNVKAEVYVDTAIPVITIAGPVSAENNTVTLNVTVTDFNPTAPVVSVADAEGNAVTASVKNETSVEGGKKWNVEIPFTEANADGTYTVTVNAKDTKDRQAEQKLHTILKDSLAPRVSINEVGGYVKAGNYEFQGTAVDLNLETVKIELIKDGEPTGRTENLSTDRDNKWSWKVYELADGAYSVKVTAKDRAGHTASVTSGSVVVDTTAPVNTISFADTTTLYNAEGESLAADAELVNGATYYAKAGYTITGSIEETNFSASNVALSSHGRNPTLIVDEDTKTWRFSGFTGNGEYTYTIAVTDRAGNRTEKTITVVYDIAGPELVLQTPAENESFNNENVTIKGTIEDEGIGVKTLKYSLNGGQYNDISVSGKNWTADIDLGETEGSYTITVIAEDKLGQVSKIENRAFYFDHAAPEVTITGKTTRTENGDFTIDGTVHETNGLASVVISDGSRVLANLTGLTGTNGNYTWSHTLETGTGDGKVGEGTHSYTIEATDIAGKKSAAKIVTVTVDTTAPNLSNGDFVDDLIKLDESVLGNVTVVANDIGGTGLSSVQYYISSSQITLAAAKSLAENKWTSMNQGTDNWNAAANFSGKSEGTYYIYFKATDNARNVNVIKGTKSINVDKAAPKIVTEGSLINTNSTSTDFVVTVKDTNVHLTEGLTAKIGDTALTVSVLRTVSGGKEYTVTVPMANGDEKTVALTAKDANGRTVTENVNFVCDTSAPLITLTGTYAEYTNANSVEIKGTAKDSHINAGNVSVTLKAAGKADKTGIITGQVTGTGAERTYSWTANVYGLENAAYTVVITATDSFGNTTTYSGAGLHTVTNDTVKPTAELTVAEGHLYRLDGTEATIGSDETAGGSTYYVKDTFKITGTVTETNYDATKVTLQKGNGTPVQIGKSGKVFEYKWTYVDADTSDGENDYTLVLEDKAGNRTERKITVICDTTNPELAVTVPAEGESFSGNTIEAIKGTVTDSGIGLGTNSIKYVIKQPGKADRTETATPVGRNWSFPNISLGDDEGSFTITVTATDKLGNSAEIANRSFYYDHNSPELSETTVGSPSVTINGDITFGGSVKESNGLDKIEIFKDGAATPVETISGSSITPAGDVYTWSKKFLATDIGDGHHTYTFKATDIAGKASTTVTRTITLDTVSPTLTGGKFIAESGKTNAMLYQDKASYANVTVDAEDNAQGSGISKVYYLTTESTASQPAANAAGWTAMSQGMGHAWNSPIDCSAYEEGNYKVWFKAQDIAGNNKIEAGSNLLTIDKTEPSIKAKFGGSEVTSFTANAGNLVDEGTEKTLTFTVEVTDTNVASTGGLTASGGKSGTTPVVTAGSYASGVKTYTVKVYAITDGNANTITLTAKDENGRTSSKNVTFTCDIVKPVITIDTYTTFTNKDSVEITGKVKEKNLSSVEVELENTTDASDKKTATISLKNDNTDASGETKIWTAKVYELNDATYSVNVTAKDTYNNTKTESGSDNITIDPDKPETTLSIVRTDNAANKIFDANGVAVTTFADGGTYYAGGAYKITGVVTETNYDYKETKYKLGDGSQTVCGNSTNKTWTITGKSATDGTEDGKYTYTIYMKDKAGNPNTVTVTVVYDTKGPELSITNPDHDLSGSDSISGSNYTFRGTIGDGSGSGIPGKKFRYYFTPNRITGTTNGESNILVQARKATAVSGWTETTGDSLTKTYEIIEGRTPVSGKIQEGQGYLYIYAKDAVGNESYVERSFWVDKYDPKITLDHVTTPTKGDASGAVTISGKAEDTNTITSLTITLDGTSVGYDSFDTTTGIFSKKLTRLGDGSHTVKIEATDKATKKSDVSVTFVYDTKAPKATITLAPLTGESFYSDEASNKWVKASQKINVSVDVDDSNGTAAVAGIKEVEIVAVKAADTPNFATNTTQLRQVGNTSTYTGTITLDQEGENRIYVKVTDNADNSDSTEYETIWLDATAPNVCKVYDVATGGTEFTGTKYNNGKSDTVVYVEAGDVTGGTGIKSVAYKGGTAVTTAETGGRYKITIPKTHSGSVEFDVIDKAGNKTTLKTFEYRLDNVAPSTEIYAIDDADESTSDKLDVNGTFVLKGTSSDNLSGVKAIAQDGIVLKYEIGDAETDKPADAEAWTSITDKFTVTGTPSNWTASIDTVTLNKDGKYLFVKAFATDEAGNTGSSAAGSDKSEMTFYINQDSDRPIITFTNVNLTDPDDVWLINGSRLQGTISDDDGLNGLKFQYKDATVTGDTWHDVARQNSGSWSIPDIPDGSHEFLFMVTDAATGVYESGDYESKTTSLPKLSSELGGAPITTGNVTLKFSVDGTKPSYKDIKFKVDSKGFNNASNLTFGGKNNKFEVKLTAGDKNGIKSVKINFNGTDYSAAMTGTETPDGDGIMWAEWTYSTAGGIPIPEKVSGSPFTGSKQVKIIVVDNAGLEYESVELINVDNEAPVINFTSHKNDDTDVVYATETVAVRGTAPGDINKMYYAVTESSTAPNYDENGFAFAAADEDKYPHGTLVPNTSITMMFDGGSDIGAEKHFEKLNEIICNMEDITPTELANTDNYRQIYIWAFGVDNAGNISVPRALHLQVIPNGDKPTVAFVNPAENNTSVGGRIRISGTANIYQDEIDAVYIQMNRATLPIGKTFEESMFGTGNEWKTFATGLTHTVESTDTRIYPDYTGAEGESREGKLVKIFTDEEATANDNKKLPYQYGIKVNGTSSWNFTLNNYYELDDYDFNADAGNYNIIMLKIFAVSKTNKNVSDPEIRYIKIDPNSPTIEDVELVKADSSRQEYTAGMWIKGKWILKATIKDASGIQRIQVRTPDQPSGIDIVDGGQIKKAEWVEAREEDTTDGSYKNYNVTIPVGTDDEGFGGLEYSIYAQDGSDQALPVTQSFNMNYDNTRPVITPDSSVTAIHNSNGTYYFKGTFSEAGNQNGNQSGFKQIAMYFTRTIASGTNAGTYVIDPMLPGTYDSTKTPGAAGEFAGTDGRGNFIKVTDSDKSDKLYWMKRSVTITGNNTLTFAEEETINRFIRKGNQVKIDNVLYKILNVDYTNKTVSIDGSVTNAATAKYVYFALAQIIDNTKVESGKTAAYNFAERPEIPNDDDDQMVEGCTGTDANIEWQAGINTNLILDGQVKVNFVAYDKAGNTAVANYDASISNNAPRLYGVKYATDENGDGSITDGTSNTTNEWTTYQVGSNGKPIFTVQDLNTNENYYGYTGDINSKETVTEITIPTRLKVKGNIGVIPLIAGGNVGLGYTTPLSSTITKFGSVGHNDSADGKSKRSDTEQASMKIELSLKDILTQEVDTENHKTLADTDEQTLDFKVWDYTDGMEGYTTAATATTNNRNVVTVKLPVTMAIKDTVPPVALIKPFHWTDASDNSLFRNSRDNGHIELEADWKNATGYSSSATSGVYDSDPKVSGIITVEGVAIDNVVVKKLYAQIDGYNSGTKFLIAERTSETDATWKSTDAAHLVTSAVKTLSTDWAFEFVSESYDEYGSNTVNFKFHFNTAKVSGVAAADRKIVFQAQDRGAPTVNGDTITYSRPTDSVTANLAQTSNNAVSATWNTVKNEAAAQVTYFTDSALTTPVVMSGENKTADTATVYKKGLTGRYQVDVVPYIREVKTQLSGSERIPSALNRSAKGYYAVRRGETIKLKGFNLNATDATNKTKVQINGTDVTTLGVTSDSNELVVPVGAGFTNGGIAALVKNGDDYISSLNNVNATPTFDSEMNCTAYAYNAEPNDRNNNILTDDRKLYIMDVTQTVSTGEVRKVDMELSGNQINFSAGYKDNKFATFVNASGTSAGTAYLQRASYTRYFENKMAVNESGTIFTVSSCGDTYNVPVSDWASGPSKFAITRGNNNNGSSNIEYSNAYTNMAYLESNWNGANFNNLDREQWPDMVVTGNDTLSKIYLTYYDTTQKLVKFRYIESGSGTKTTGYTTSNYLGGSTLNMYTAGSAGIKNTEQAVSIYTTGGKTYNQGYVAIAGGNVNSPYSAVAVANGTAIVSWFDAYSKALKMKYNTSPATSFSGYQTFNELPTTSEYVLSNNNISFTYNDAQKAFYSASLNNNTSGGKYVEIDGTKYKLVLGQRVYVGNTRYYHYTLENYSGTNNFTSAVYTYAVTGYGGTFNISVDGGTSKEVSISCSTPSGGDINHEFAYQLGLVLSEGGYGAYCEVDPKDNKVTVRSMQTGTDSSISITNLSSGSVNTAVAGCGQPWVEKTIDDDEAGKYVSMTVDSKNGIHMAYHSTGTADLKYAYLSSVTADPVVVTVDGYQQVGQYIDIATATKTIDGNSCIVPFISYYNLSYADSTSAVKCAYLNKPLIPSAEGTTATISESNAQGSVDEMFTGNWEVTSIPCATTPVQYRVNIGVKTNGDVILSYLGNTIEYVKVW